MDQRFRITGLEWVILVCDFTVTVAGLVSIILKPRFFFLFITACAAIAFIAKLVDLIQRRKAR